MTATAMHCRNTANVPSPNVIDMHREVLHDSIKHVLRIAEQAMELELAAVNTSPLLYAWPFAGRVGVPAS